jgi:hypothetical protein
MTTTPRRPLSAHALEALREVKDQPLPCQRFNAGVTGKLLFEGYCESVMLPSPYETHKPGTRIPHLKIRPPGLQAIAK